MGSFLAVEVCHLDGLHVLRKLGNIFSNYGLYRDDGFGIVDL